MKYVPAIQFVAPYRIYLPDEFFDVLIDGKLAKVKAVPLISGGPSNAHGQNFEVVHDIFGFAGRTIFYVALDEEIDTNDPQWKEKLCCRDTEILKFALAYVNRLLAVYRDQDVNRVGVASFHVIELVREDLSDISLVIVDDELNQMQDFAVTWPGFRSMGFGEAVHRDLIVVENIRQNLVKGITIPIEREILSSASNHLWRQQLRLVPIEANAAFESYTYSALKRASPEATLSEASDLFEKLKTLDEVFFDKDSVVHERWFTPAVPGWRGIANTFIRQWHSNCYELRNKVIHRGYNNVTTEQAKAALDSTKGVISMIEGYLLHLAQ